MKTAKTRISSTILLIACLALCACGKDSSSTSTPQQAATSDHDHDATPQAHHGPSVELGTTTIGPFTVRAARDQGQIVAGGDAPIDVWLTAPADSGVGLGDVIAVRFWIGVESADGSVKAKAEIENPAQPNHWHTHAEVPDPLPIERKLWVEIEVRDQGKKAGSFEL